MRTWLAGAGLIVILGACGDLPTTPESAQIAAVMIGTGLYSPSAVLDPETQVLGGEYTRVVRFVDCSKGVWVNGNLISDHCPLQDGESNYLPTGTPIFRIEGVEPADGLAVEYSGEWEVLLLVEIQENGEAS